VTAAHVNIENRSGWETNGVKLATHKIAKITRSPVRLPSLYIVVMGAGLPTVLPNEARTVVHAGRRRGVFLL
jgi:hypothetical protein